MRSIILCLAYVLAMLICDVARGETIEKQAGTFDSAGVKIAYVVAGKGEPVVLIHGLYSNAATNWEMPGTFALLAKHYRVVALDLRGHGQSGKPEDEAAYGKPFVDDVIHLMDHLQIKKAHIVGYSLGGIIAMRVMVDHPDRVITGTLGGMGWLKEGSAFQAVFERMGGAKAGRTGTPPACVHGIAKLAVTEDEIKAVEVPVHILVGDRDPCKRMYVEPLEKIRPDWPVTEIEGAGHLTCIMKQEFKGGLVKWLDQHAK